MPPRVYALISFPFEFVADCKLDESSSYLPRSTHREETGVLRHLDAWCYQKRVASDAYDGTIKSTFRAAVRQHECDAV